MSTLSSALVVDIELTLSLRTQVFSLSTLSGTGMGDMAGMPRTVSMLPVHSGWTECPRAYCAGTCQCMRERAAMPVPRRVASDLRARVSTSARV